MDNKIKSLFDTDKHQNISQKKEIDDLEKLKPDKTFGGLTVSGDVLLNKLEVEIVNTPEFQRLRKIKQLGATNLVYPSAIHTRFEHSLGVLKMADIIINKIRNNRHSSDPERKITAEEEQIIRLLALLHDIGHMPFGHTIEDEFGIFKSHDKHETRWEYFLGQYSNIGRIVIKNRNLDFHKRFFQLIKCDKIFLGFEKDAFMYDIVSNTVCADLLDYLKRDCLHTDLKLKYHPRFLDYFYIKPVLNQDKNSENRIVIRVAKTGSKKELRKDTISELIQLLRNRYYLGERVYYHHAKVKTGTLLAGAILRAKSANAFKELDLDIHLKAIIKANKDSAEDKKLYNAHLMGDDEIIQYIQNISSASKSKEQVEKINSAKKMAKLFDGRILYKQLEVKNKHDLGIQDEFDTRNIMDGNFDRVKNRIALRLHQNLVNSAINRLEIEDRICDYLDGMDSGDLLIYCPNFNMSMKLARAKISNVRGEIFELRDFQDDTIRKECESVLDKHQDLWAIRIFIHPKYMDKDHPDYLEKYENYIKIIRKYIDWRLFSRDEEVKNKGEQFWQDYITFFISKISDEMKSRSPHEINTKVNELVEELMSATSSMKSATEIKKNNKN